VGLRNRRHLPNLNLNQPESPQQQILSVRSSIKHRLNLSKHGEKLLSTVCLLQRQLSEKSRSIHLVTSNPTKMAISSWPFWEQISRTCTTLLSKSARLLHMSLQGSASRGVQATIKPRSVLYDHSERSKHRAFAVVFKPKRWQLIPEFEKGYLQGLCILLLIDMFRSGAS
jgi:hypothetical protein